MILIISNLPNIWEVSACRKASLQSDFDKLIGIGVLEYLKELKAKGIVRHIGFSSHTPSVANRIIDTGLIDMMMFSINPAYDFEKVVASSPKDAELRILKSKLHEFNNGLMICQVWNGTIFATDLKGEAITFEITKTEEAW